MKTACSKQCDQCPFRHSSLPTYLGDYDMATVANSVWRNMPFFCHTKINYRDPNWLEKAQKNGKICLGSLVFADKMMAPKRPDAYPESDREIFKLREETVNNKELVVDCMSPVEFVAWHDPSKRDKNMELLPAMLKKFPRKVTL